MKRNWSQDLYIKTYKFAAKAHHEQKIPGSDLPYIVHLSLVSMEIMALLSIEDGLDGDLAVQCALLHDTIEDAKIPYNVLKDKFGMNVADGVLALSKDDMIIDKQNMMLDSLKRIKQQSKEIWCVKLADRITNLQPPPTHWDAEKIESYRTEAVLIYDELKNASGFLADRLKTKIEDYNF